MVNPNRIIGIAFAIASAIAPSTSWATSELHKNVTVGFVGEIVAKLNAGSEFSFSIVDDGSDAAYNAIVSVFIYPERTVLAEGYPNPYGDVPHTAGIILSATNSDREVYVLVRPVGDAEASVTLRATRRVVGGAGGVGSRDIPLYTWVSPAARRQVPSGLTPKTHVWTTQENAITTISPGADDTVLLVLQDGGALAFDDDSGVTRMSWLHLFQPCLGTAGHTCELVVAQRSNDKGGRAPGEPGYSAPPTDVHRRHVTLAWDEDIHNGRDADDDGLGDALEDFIGSNKSKVDTDNDGVPDGVEVIGVKDDPRDEETAINLLRFPYYGADPTKPDLFIEADWMPGCAGGPPICPDNVKHQHRLGVSDASSSPWF